MSEIKVNKISPKQLCTQLTLGDSGDTIIIPAGATITNNGTATGFGRTGTVDWDTTKKTTGFTAVNGVGYFCDTTSAAFTVTLPAAPSAGDIVALKDYANTFDTNNLTIGRNGSNINGAAANAIISVQGQALTLIYIDATQGWSAIYGATDADLPIPTYIAATGGTVLTCGDFKTHVFTGPGTFTVTSVGSPGGSNSVEYLVVAGGGGGGMSDGGGGGGGAGGYRQNYPSPTTAGLPVTAQGYPITVGGGGPGGPGSGTGGAGTSGNPSIFSTITSTAGGGGGGTNSAPANVGLPGGSGGGGGRSANPSTTPAGTGNTPPTSPPQGNSGGNGGTSGQNTGGGGGGAAAAGTAASPGSGGGPGGIGSPIATTFFGPTAPSYGTPGPAPGRYFAGGGGGNEEVGPAGSGAGGAGGGGAGGGFPGVGAQTGGNPGTINTGGGGGGGDAITPQTGGNGGSGIVFIRYKFQ
jgi:hypothetical protein